jgi:hypothetical protein
MRTPVEQGLDDFYIASRRVLLAFMHSPTAMNAEIGDQAADALVKLLQVMTRANKGEYTMQDPTPLKEAGEDVAKSDTPAQLLKELYDKNTTLAALGLLGITEGTICDEIGTSLVETLDSVAKFYGEDYQDVVITRTQTLAAELIDRQYRKG